MKFDKNLAAIHGYLCGDGYVITNPPTQKHKYYHVGFRNTNKVLLKDFQQKFAEVFGLKPIITNEGRCRIQNKEIYYFLTKDFSYYSYEWKLPKLSRENLKHWLRAFFDCESWVQNQPAKSRIIGLDCCNKSGLFGIRKALKKFNIDSGIKKRKSRTIWSLTICGLDDLKRFYKFIDYNHPSKKQKLIEALNSYMNYTWKMPKSRKELLKFIKEKGRANNQRKEIRFNSIKKYNVLNLKKVLNKHRIKSKIFGPWMNTYGSKYYCLIIKMNGGENARSKRIRRDKAWSTTWN